MEMLITLFGMCLTCLPFVLFVHYLFEHIKEEADFDRHVEKMEKEKKEWGVLIAYTNKMSLGIGITTLGIFLSNYFKSIPALKLTLVMFVLFIISSYFDKEET